MGSDLSVGDVWNHQLVRAVEVEYYVLSSVGDNMDYFSGNSGKFLLVSVHSYSNLYV